MRDKNEIPILAHVRQDERGGFIVHDLEVKTRPVETRHVASLRENQTFDRGNWKGGRDAICHVSTCTRMA